MLGVRLAEDGGRVMLRLRYRTDVLDADSAARIAVSKTIPESLPAENESTTRCPSP